MVYRTVIKSFLILIIIFIAFIYAESDGQNQIGYNCSSLAFKADSNNIVLGVGDSNSNEIVLTDMNLNIVRRINISNFPYCMVISHDYSKLFIGTWLFNDLNNPDPQENGWLLIYNTINWQLGQSISLPSYPVNICHSESEPDIVFVACSANYDSAVQLVRINLSTSEILRNDFSEAPCSGLVLNHDETKLYVGSNETFTIYQDGYFPIDRRDRIYVLNPATLSNIGNVDVEPNVMDVIRGQAGKILVAHGNPFEYENYTCLSSVTVIATTNDTIDRTITIPDLVGCRFLQYDSVRNYLYTVPLIMTILSDPEIGDVPERITTEKVVRINFTNDSINWLTVASERIGSIGLSPDGSRLYACPGDGNSQTVYYMDL